MAMDYSSRANLDGLSPLHGPVPALPTIYTIYMRNANTFSHHLSSRHICSVDRPLPLPTHGHRCR